jgi:hypothetical protein
MMRREADVGFTTCGRGHRIVVHRVGRSRGHFALAADGPVAAETRSN